MTISAGYFGLGTFHSLGDVSGECAVCYSAGTMMLLEDIPPAVQDKLGVSSVESVIFLETEGSETEIIHDLFYFENHPHLGQLPVACFADIGMTVAVKSLPDKMFRAEDVIGHPVRSIEPTGETPAEMIDRWVTAHAAA